MFYIKGSTKDSYIMRKITEGLVAGIETKIGISLIIVI